jgi:hypothetical protein
VLDGPFIYGSAFHTDQEMILVVNEKYEYILTQAIVLRRHVMLGMRQYARLEDGSQIVSRHLVDISLGSKDGKQIQNIQKELAVEGRKALDQVLVYAHHGIRVETAY